jgi:NADH-quinone oxidoreductase subunit E
MAIESSVKKNIDLTQIEQICKEHQGRKGDLLIVLQKIQALCGYAPQAALPIVTRHLGATPSEIYGVLTFYNRFHLSPRGKHTIRACRGTACHFKGSLEILDKMREHLKMGPKQDTSDNTLFSIEEVACLGACGIAPVITVDEEVFGKLEPETAVEIVARYEEAEKGKEG